MIEETAEVKYENERGREVTTEITALNIEHEDIAKLLFSLRGTTGETPEQLVGRVEEEFQIGGNEARNVISYFKVAGYLSEEIIKGPEDYEFILYKLTQKGEEFIPQHL